MLLEVGMKDGTLHQCAHINRLFEQMRKAYLSKKFKKYMILVN